MNDVIAAGNEAAVIAEPGMLNAYVFLLSKNEDKNDIAASTRVLVGTFRDADAAWATARAKCNELGGVACTVCEIHSEPDLKNLHAHAYPAPTHMLTRRLIHATGHWAQQNLDASNAKVIGDAACALDDCLMRCWTEIDEALIRFQIAADDLRRERNQTAAIKDALDHICVGSGFLHRWQNRGGRTGNVG